MNLEVIYSSKLQLMKTNKLMEKMEEFLLITCYNAWDIKACTQNMREKLLGLFNIQLDSSPVNFIGSMKSRL